MKYFQNSANRHAILEFANENEADIHINRAEKTKYYRSVNLFREIMLSVAYSFTSLEKRIEIVKK